jgi:hypothetical protein
MLRPASISVRGRIVRVMLATTLAALVVTGAVMMFQEMRVYERSLVQDLTTQAEILGRASAAALTTTDAQLGRENLALLRAKPVVRAAALYDARGALFAAYVRDGGRVADEVPQHADADGAQLSGNAAMLFRRITGDQGPVGTIYL